MTDQTLSFRLEVANGRALLDAAESGQKAMRDMQDTARKANEEMRHQARATGSEVRRQIDAENKANEERLRAGNAYVSALRRQADTLGMTRSQVMAYDAAQRGLNQTQGQAAAASIVAIDAYERKQAVLGRVQVMATAAGAALAGVLIGGVKASVSAAAEAEQAQLRLEAVLRGTGYAAGFTGEELDRMASRLEGKLGIDDETIKQSMATLLTFRQVGRESFEDVLTMAANLSALLKTDLHSAVIQIGKVMESPEQGLTALSRAGIVFEGTQKKVIVELMETGRHAEAVTAIMEELKSRGLDRVQESMNKGLVGSSNSLRNSWDNLLETMGKSSVIMTPVLATIDGITKGVRTLQQAADGGVGNAFLSFATFGLVTPDIKPAPQQSGNSEAAAAAAGAERRESERIKAAQDRAADYLAQFRTDNQKLEAELQKWNRLADAAGYSADQRASGESAIRGRMGKKGGRGDSKAGAQLVAGLSEQLRQTQGEATAFDKVMEQVTSGTQKFTHAEIAAALAIAGEIDELRRGKLARDAAVKSAELMTVQQERQDQILAALNESLSTQAQNLQMEIDLMGASDGQREKAIALRELDNKFRRETIELQGEELERALELYRIEREKISGLLDQRGAAQARKKAMDDARAEHKRFEDDISRGLTDSIFRGFEGGESFGRNFWESMKNMAKTTVLQPVVKFLMSPVTGAITGTLGSLGIPGMANASTGGGGGGMGNILGSVGNLFSGGDVLGSLLSVPNAIFQNAGVSMGSQLIADIGNFGYGTPVLAGITNLLAGNVQGAIGSTALGALGTFFGGPIGGAIGSAVGSLIGGSKKAPAVFTGYNLAGSVTGSGISGMLYGTASGGSGNTDWAHADLATAYGGAFAAQNARVVELVDQVTRIAGSLGYSSSGPISASYNLAGVSDAQIASGEAITLAMEQVTDQIVRQLIPNFSQLARAGESAAATLGRLNAEAQQASLGRMQAALGLADSTRDLWLSELSPLSPEARLKEAGLRYSETLELARGGDASAIAGLSGMSRSYLQEARGYYASGSGYADIFSGVQTDVRGLVEDTLVEQSMAFADMAGSLARVEGYAATMPERLAVILDAAAKARDLADAASRRAQTVQMAQLINEVRDMKHQLARVNT